MSKARGRLRMQFLNTAHGLNSHTTLSHRGQTRRSETSAHVAETALDGKRTGLSVATLPSQRHQAGDIPAFARPTLADWSCCARTYLSANLAFQKKRKQNLGTWFFKTGNPSTKTWVLNGSRKAHRIPSPSIFWNKPWSLPSTKNYSGREAEWYGRSGPCLFRSGKGSLRLKVPEAGQKDCSENLSGNAPQNSLPRLYLDDFGELVERVLAVATVLLGQLQDVPIDTGGGRADAPGCP